VILLSIIYLVLLSCIKKNETASMMEPVSDTLHTYLALGDSYTIGEAVADSKRFPAQTVKLLANKNIQCKTSDIIAANGWATTDLLNALALKSIKNNYSIVSLLIGVNNQYQHKPIDQYKKEFTGLLHKAIAYTGYNSRVMVLSIPDYSVMPFAAKMDTARIAKEIDAFNAANKEISLNAGVQYIDITPISREAKNNPALIARDGLHPSAYQYLLWSQLLTDKIIDVLQ